MTVEPDRLERLMRYVAWIARLGLTPDKAQQAAKARDHALAGLTGVRYAAAGSKPYTGHLSPGCASCGQGVWSCLFINSLCTANCFYCPQDRSRREEREPIAEEIPFSDPNTYIAYLRQFGFRGVSFSGGEPLIVFDKVMTYLDAIKAAFNSDMYVWLYTNGDLVDSRKLLTLRDAGLDEIRFDISARDYDLQPVALARKHIPTVTVEIPAIPEDAATVERCLRSLNEIGVDHINLHQLVATEHNITRLRDRGYTFLSPLSFREPPVLESELAALHAMSYAAEQGLALSINYCSHAYKARFQNLARRQRAAPWVHEPFERITAAGYLARWCLMNAPAELEAMADALRGAGIPTDLWSLDAAGSELALHEKLLGHPALGGRSPMLTYFEADISATRRPGAVREIALTKDKMLHLTRRQVAHYEKPAAAALEAWECVAAGLQTID